MLLNLASVITSLPANYLILTSLPHSTETALLYIHDHLINAIGSQKVSCLCLLDLSAVFDTIDHNVQHLNHSPLILVWYSWLRSQLVQVLLSSRSFRAKCDNNLSSFHTSSCGVPQGSVLGPPLFVMYTTPLSTLISSISLDYHLYADDTQLFSFNPNNFDSTFLTFNTLFDLHLHRFF